MDRYFVYITCYFSKMEYYVIKLICKKATIAKRNSKIPRKIRSRSRVEKEGRKQNQNRLLIQKEIKLHCLFLMEKRKKCIKEKKSMRKIRI